MVSFASAFLFVSLLEFREHCPAASSLTSRQTLMPERDQPHFHVEESRPHGGPVSFLVDLRWDHSRRIAPICRRLGTSVCLRVGPIYFRSERGNRNLRRIWGSHLRKRIPLRRNHSESVILKN